MIVAAILCTILTSCDDTASKVRDAVSEIQRDLRVSEREEIEKVLLAYKNFEEKHRIDMLVTPDRQGQAEALRLKFSNISTIDVTSCPQRFREVWYTYRGACLEICRFLERAPINDSDAVAYQWQKLLEGKLDGGRSDLLEQGARMEDSLNTALLEVIAVAKEYGVQ